MQDHVAAFLDTNIYLHFRPIQDVDWCALLDAERVTIVLPSIIFSQLDHVKESGRTSKLRNRAGRIAHRLENYLSQDHATVRDHVHVVYFGKAVAVDYAKHELNPDVEDDRLLGAMLMYKDEEPSATLVLISDDVGPRVKASQMGIAARSLPEELRLPQGPDATEKELRQLRRKYEKMMRSQPDLRLEYESGKQHHHFDLPPALGTLTDERVNREMNARREDCRNRRGDFSAIRMLPIAEEEYARYDRDVEQYLNEHREYLRANWAYEAAKRRCLTLRFFLANVGGAPADDIDIMLHLPDGFALYDEDELREELHEPKAPAEPVAPRTQAQVIIENFDRHIPSMPYVPGLDTYSFPSEAGRPNVSRPIIERSNSYDVTWQVERLKQNLREPLTSLVLVFNHDQEVGPFGVDYRINAANIPDDTEGKLNIVVHRPNAE